MKTNTTKLRRALETFAKTGKITLTASALMALALSAAPADATSITDTLVDGDAVTIEQDTTVTSPVTIPANLSIIGNAPSTTLSGKNTNAILIAPEAASSLTLKDLTFDSGIGYLPEGEGTRGGAIYGSKLTIDTDNVTFKNSSTDQFGGAVASEGSLTLTGSSIFTNNTSKSDGGAIGSGSNISIQGTHTFDGNHAALGGALGSVWGSIQLSGNITFTNNTSKYEGGAIKAVGGLTFSGDDSIITFSGNTEKNGQPNDIYTGHGNNTVAMGPVTIQDAGTYTFGGGIVSTGLDISDANVTFKDGSKTNISGAVTLTDATVTIEGGDGAFKIGSKTETGSMTANTGSTLNLVYTGSGTGTMITGDVTGLANASINTRFTDLQDGILGNIELTSNGLNVVHEEGETFNIYRNGAYVSKSDTVSGLAALTSNDELIVADTPAAFDKTLAVPENLTIRSNSLGTDRTITASGTTPMFSTAGTSTLTLENITISGGTSNLADTVGGSVITSGNWIINGGTFTGNSAITVDKATGDMTAKGGAISGGQIDLSNTTFEDNHAKTGSYTDASKDGATITTPYGGAVYGSLVTVSGDSRFTGNSVSSGNPYYNGLTGKANNETLGGAIAGASGNSNEQANIDAIVIGGTDKDTITFSDNHAYALEETNSKSSSSGGAVGGALGTHVGKVTINAEAGDSITFTKNTAEAKFSRAAGGAIGAGAQDKWGTVEINADKDSTVLFKDNMAYSADGAARVIGGAIYSRSDVDVTNVTFDGNKALLENGKGGDVEVGGGAIYNHKGNTTITDSTFTNNSATGTGDLTIATGGAIHSAEASLTLTGTNTFTGNSVSNENGDAQGGAIYGEEVAFVGDGSEATFTGNTANGVNNDVHAESSVTFDGNGEYTFGGGITTGDNAGMEVNGSTLNFEAGSITDIAGTVGLKDATLNITATDETVFNARDVKRNGDNYVNLDFHGTEQWTMGADFGDALVNESAKFTTVKSGNGKTVVSFKEDLGFAVMAKNAETGLMDFQGSDANMGTTYGTYTLQANDFIIATKDGDASGPISVDGLTIKSSDDTIRTITGTGTVLSDISSVNLKNVTLTLKSGDAATIKTSKDLTVNADGKSTVDSINAASVKVGGNGQLIVNSTINSTINGSTEVLTGANLAISQRTDVTGALNVAKGATLTLSDIAMTFEEVKDANGNTVVDENGKPVKTPVVDTIEIGGAISFADDAVIEISFDETFNLDAPGTYEIMKGTSLVDNGAEFSFVDAIAQLNNDMLQLSVVDGALMLDVKGFGTVPEPSTWALLILGGLGVFGVARKNRKAKK